VFFRNNKFRDNGNGDLVVCAGSELVFEGNEFEKSVIVWGRPHNYVFRDNDYRGGNVHYSTRTGVAEIHDNRYANCKLAITFDTKAVADGLARRPGQAIATPPLTLRRETLTGVTSMSGTYFDLDQCELRDTAMIAGKETRLVRLRDCKVADSTLTYEADGPEVAVQLDALSGTLTESGPGLARKRKSP